MALSIAFPLQLRQFQPTLKEKSTSAWRKEHPISAPTQPHPTSIAAPRAESKDHHLCSSRNLLKRKSMGPLINNNMTYKIRRSLQSHPGNFRRLSMLPSLINRTS
jgi:hypothetical protein